MKLIEPVFDTAEIEKVSEVLASQWVTQGEVTAEFERVIGERHQAKYCFATNSCTTALFLSTLALGLKKMMK